MVSASIHILLYTLLFFLIGMYKPKWALFFLNKPTRFIISIISLVAFMVGATLYGEGHKEELLQAKKITEKAALISEVPIAK